MAADLWQSDAHTMLLVAYNWPPATGRLTLAAYPWPPTDDPLLLAARLSPPAIGLRMLAGEAALCKSPCGPMRRVSHHMARGDPLASNGPVACSNPTTCCDVLALGDPMACEVPMARSSVGRWRPACLAALRRRHGPWRTLWPAAFHWPAATCGDLFLNFDTCEPSAQARVR